MLSDSIVWTSAKVSRQVIMGWFAKLFGYTTPPGIRIDFQNAWEVSAPKNISAFIRKLTEIMPPGAILYLESTSSPSHITRILDKIECEPQAQVARGTIWPKPRCFHIPMTEKNLNAISELLENNAQPEVCDHFHIYAENMILLEWHDAFFNDPFLVTGQISEEKLKVFCDSIRSSYQKATGNS